MNKPFNVLTPEQEAELESFKPIRVIVRVRANQVEAMVEHSWSMDWGVHHVSIFRSGKAYSMLGEHDLDGIKDAKANNRSIASNQFIVDPFEEGSPIEIDWSTWIKATDKFGSRNAPYRVVQNGEFVLRALTAERQLLDLQRSYDSLKVSFHDADEALDKIRSIVCPSDDHDTLGEDQ
jgi:hypothetical protein